MNVRAFASWATLLALALVAAGVSCGELTELTKELLSAAGKEAASEAVRKATTSNPR